MLMPREDPDSVWGCSDCIRQMAGLGRRCHTHNPTPEERDARAVWQPVLDAVVAIEPANVTPAYAAWLVEEVAEQLGEADYARQLIAQHIEPEYAF
jgi:hypothetical protein